MARVTEIEKRFSFEAAHFLPAVPADHKCASMHGHSFRVVVTVRGALVKERGWLIDFAELDEAWRPLHALLDHKLLNEVEGLENPTSELLADWILNRFVVEGARVHKVWVAETCRSACAVYADD